MGWWQVDTDTLAGGRFVVSPLSEAISSLKLLQLHAPAAHPGDRSWLDTHLPAFRRRVAEDPLLPLLLHCAFRPTWNADFITPAPVGDGKQDFARELERVRAAPAESVLDDLAVALGGPPPAELLRTDLAERAAALLDWVWQETVLPEWPRRRRVLEADIVARTAQLSRAGWVAALGGMRPGMRWLGGDRLQINTQDHPPREVARAQLLFVPVSFATSWVSWEGRRRFAVVYPCAGALADADRGRTSAPGALAALLGPARAGILVLLGSPKSTTQLVALTGLALGSVGRHLKVLLDARLVRRRRAGRSVLYYRTDSGDVLVNSLETGP
ncbi:ArsR family transcriptional regulator [Streptomyces candidus]|uniref:AcrR family transcriptional regulator n=1 Tax=Streptomyces candidus TaxID=67283 RepID=A0A7X0HBW4_9ACTN|nr:ArsR family transcriptional regulator [Streptomyces candidus]MBB6434621.1 AcrR family transcriptional regulator [Streptomyces candidus]GHH36031.1 transcriptional regulator [Streptomyces candidus]